ncbi:sensitivity to high expression protein she9 [Recurvomyces mirabilis]|uniref:Sensitive to high expression protein 9, mitochondrial n=1 Tax=Recurvomyces mirabilis TaxID=574656 RepID=A0AAE0WUW6_9PEZI|nr:sensitivity to high expression protein she9 [Recurvomyces mirabilis]KAK5160606.1 sensitivity to high expression protein she9 [Recurvomyces mirabilis]
MSVNARSFRDMSELVVDDLEAVRTMQPSFRPAVRLAGTVTPRVIRNEQTRRVLREVIKGSAWTCLDCRAKAQSRGFKKLSSDGDVARRSFSTTVRRRDETHNAGLKKPIDPRAAIASTANARSNDTEAATDSSTLPSYVEKQRWQFSKDTTQIIDRLLARASIAGQHINVYTGTDYSGIEALRNKITMQEETVRAVHRAVDNAKANHHKTIADQAGAQKEIVGLLERKSSWAPNDLETYMSLVRSEHLNDQSVQTAKDTLRIAERELEDARSLLERLERKQYHEEQIWSDTIRRNSTWLTFGLMGVNILLLLTQIAIFEPMRRRRIVRDVKSALDERTIHKHTDEVMAERRGGVVEQQVDEVVQPASTLIEDIEGAAQVADVSVASQAGIRPRSMEAGETALAAGEVLPEEAVEVVDSVIPSVDAPALTSWETYQTAFHELFSERLVQLKQVELTTIALQGAATGAAVISLLVLVLRPK